MKFIKLRNLLRHKLQVLCSHCLFSSAEVPDPSNNDNEYKNKEEQKPPLHLVVNIAFLKGESQNLMRA